MMDSFYYKVADHVFALNVEGDHLGDLWQYEPFRTEPADDVVFRLETVGELPVARFHEMFRQEDKGQTILAGHTDTGEPYFEFLLGKVRSAVLLTSADYRVGRFLVKDNWTFSVNNALMIMYALSTSNSRTALFHSSVVACQGRAYMFLGKSGTGKSTHSSLWLKHVPGAELLNDDNPVVRILDNNEVRVYGSPWSGKTPCYRNLSCPLGAIVKLRQAPYNRMERIKGVNAYVTIMPSISGKRWDSSLAAGIHKTESLLAELVPIWRLECRPDEAAVLLCRDQCICLERKK